MAGKSVSHHHDHSVWQGEPSVTAQIGTRILRDNGRRFLVVSEELCYGRAETLEDAEEAVRRWRYNLVR